MSDMSAEEIVINILDRLEAAILDGERRRAASENRDSEMSKLRSDLQYSVDQTRGQTREIQDLKDALKRARDALPPGHQEKDEIPF